MEHRRPGVYIGNGCVIGAGSIVTKDIPDFSIAAGNPCKVIRKITEDDRKIYFRDREFDEAAAEVINQNFNLAFQIKKLSKASKDRQYRMRVYRNLCPEGEKWSAEIKEKAMPARIVDLMENYAHISKAGVFFKAEWKENITFMNKYL